MRISLKKMLSISLFGIFVTVYTIILLSKRSYFVDMAVVRYVCISAFVVLALEVLASYRISNVFLTPSILFLMAFYVFQNGQLLLLALGIDFNSFYINTLNQYTQDVAIYSSISSVVAGYACLICTKENCSIENKIEPINYSIDKLNPDRVAQIAYVGFIGTTLIAVPLVFVKFFFVRIGGYTAVRNLESSIPSIVNFLEYMFFPFVLLIQIYDKQKRSNIAAVFAVIWLILTALCGDRTTGIAGLAVLAYLRMSILSHPKRGNLFKTLIIAVLLLIFIDISYIVRTRGSFSDLSIGLGLFTGFLSELGFSCFPLYTMMHTVPQYEGFRYGIGYLFSFIGGMIPSFIDPTGTIRNVNAQAHIFEAWHSRYFSQYSFGFGFSLNAESYINFGWFGLIGIFIVCLIVFHFLGGSHIKNSKSNWALYRMCVLLFLWFTLPRRDSYYIWKAISYALIIMQIYIKVGMSFCQKKN